MCFWQWVCALLFNGILCREHKKGTIQFEGLIPYGDLSLLHGFEQRGLRFRSCTVNFICKQDIAEHWARLETEFALASPLLDNICPGDIGWHQIWSVLDTRELQIHEFCHGAYGKGFCQSGIPFEECIGIAEDCDHHLPNDFVLADHDLIDFCKQSLKPLFVALHGLLLLLSLSSFLYLTSLNSIA